MFINRIINDLTARRRRRRDTLIPATLSDRRLRDIGIARYEPIDSNSYR
ncbi:hypothetical protein [Mesorhizobium sp. SP-1A]|nr:hypothetical protein [Mesorhizobium sp. SP-1A]